jgi:hypothetical protein
MKSEWTMLTKRTNDPKLKWLEKQLDAKGIPNRRNGKSFHAPIMEVQACYYHQAYDLLMNIDEIPDDDPRFS